MTKERFIELMKPIAEGLLGKPRTNYGREQPHYVVRPVGMIVEDLCAIPEDAWGIYAFSRDPLNGKFNDEQRLELTRKAIECGREYAGKISAECGTRDTEKIAEHLGLKVDFPDMPQSTDRVLFAEFRAPDKMHIYMDCVRKGLVLLSEPGVSDAMGREIDIGKLLLGHELFHFVEEKHKKEIWTRTYKIELWAPKPLHNRSTVNVLGEIAAMAFTKSLSNIPYSPYVLDAFLVYGYSPEAASGLYEEMMEKAGRTARQPQLEIEE